MARRERTTGLPRPRPRAHTRSAGRVGGLTERQLRFGLLSFAAVLFVAVVGLFGYRLINEAYLRDDKTILSVGDEKFSLGYYADRLVQYYQATQETGTTLQLAELGLVSQLETEAMTRIIAEERGITVSSEEVTAAIADGLGVPVGGSGSSFDTLYRQRLNTLNMSDKNYRRLTEGSVYRTKLIDAYKAEIGDKAELVTLRLVVVSTKEAADAILARAQAGEDLGAIAQAESTDLQTRQKDGVTTAEPETLLPEAIRTATAGKPAGSELFGPVQIEANFWVYKIEQRDPEGELTDTQRDQLAEKRLADDLAARRAALSTAGEIDRDLSASDLRWAEKNAD